MQSDRSRSRRRKAAIRQAAVNAAAEARLNDLLSARRMGREARSERTYSGNMTRIRTAYAADIFNRGALA